MINKTTNDPANGEKKEREEEASKERKSKGKSEQDVFIARAIYPDASSIFTLRVKSIQEIKDTCFVVLGTNCLLLPFTTTQESLGQIRRTYAELKKRDRLRLPAQVAREFAINRPKKISELYQQLTRKQDNLQITKSRYALLEGLDEYKKLLDIEEEISKSLDKYREQMGTLLDHIRSWTWNDPVSLVYGDIFTADTIVEPEFDDEAILTELSDRYRYNIPPGYKDQSKPDEGIGDLLIWKTILELGKQSDVIFVCGETKPDWWHRSDNQHLYPQYELIEEFRRLTGGNSFHIVPLSALLALYGARENIVQEVKEKERSITIETTASISVLTNTVEKSVLDWLTTNLGNPIYPDHPDELYDYYFVDEEGNRTAVEIKTVETDAILSSKKLGDVFDPIMGHGENLIASGRIKQYAGIFVTKSEKSSGIWAYYIDKMTPLMPPGVRLILGYVGRDGQFKTE